MRRATTRNATIAAKLGTLLVLAGAGCAVETPMAPEGDSSVPSFTRGQEGKPLPFRSEVNFSGDIIPPGQPGSAIRCDDLGLFTLLGSFEGHASHLGRTTGTFSNCTAFPIPGPVALEAGKVTIIAANGDRLFMTYVGRQDEADPATFTASYSADYRIVGGTGRFTEASGELTASGVVDFKPGAVSTEVAEGWISYNASGGGS